MARAKQKFNTEKETDPSKVRQLGTKKKFHPQDLVSFKPLTARQSDFLDHYYSGTKIILQDGCAGTGKTFVAVYCAMSEVLEPSTPYDRLIMVRSAVDTRSLGFVPGTEEEKQARYEIPFIENIDKAFRYNASYDNLKALGYTEFVHSGNLRGRTWDNAVIVVDEIQNMTYDEILTVLTRTGENSRVVLCGDIRQPDLARGSGFDTLKKLLLNMPSELTSTVSYAPDDIVRSSLVKAIIKADHSLDRA